MAHTLTIQLPDNLYRILAQRAEQAQRALPDELVQVPATAVTELEQDSETERILAALQLLSDDELWNPVTNYLPDEAAAEFELLHHKQQREGLSATEDATRGELLHRYEQAMFIRAQAALFLHQHGHIINTILRRA